MMNKKKSTKNGTLKNTKWKRGRRSIKIVYRNSKTLVGEVRDDFF